MLRPTQSRIFTPGSYTVIFLAGITVLLWLLAATPLRAQSWEVANKNLTATEQARGYWRLETNIVDRSTSIRFFTPTDELLYEETWPEKWVKLTARNRRYLDRLLAKLMAKNLVASRITIQPLPTVLVRNEADSRMSRPDTSRNTAVTPPLVFAYINPTGKIYLAVNNPEGLRYKVSLRDETGLSLYEEFTYLDHYRKWLDISNSTQGTIQLTVRINDRSFIYQVKRKDHRTYEMEAPSGGGELERSAKKQEGKNGSLSPLNTSM